MQALDQARNCAVANQVRRDLIRVTVGTTAINPWDFRLCLAALRSPGWRKRGIDHRAEGPDCGEIPEPTYTKVQAVRYLNRI
jgi:hypothetical protein